MIQICAVNEQATESLPEKMKDNSGIGVHYVDAFIKPMNTTLADGTKISCKRKGLKLLLTVGEQQGGGLMRRIRYEGDPVVMLRHALAEAAESINRRIVIENDSILISPVQNG